MSFSEDQQTRRSVLASAAGFGVGLTALRPLAAIGGSRAVPPNRPDDVVFVETPPGGSTVWDRSYSLTHQRTPRWRALCKSSAGVVAALEWADRAGLGFAIRSGGHCFEGFSQHDQLVIDLRAMDHVRLDATTGRARIGPGATVGQVNAELARHGLTLPMGYCARVGIGGHALGGGMGYLVRRHGLLSDWMTRAELVGANSQVLQVGEDAHTDLLWALRGAGGGSFGIVTELGFDAVYIGRVLRFEVSWRLASEAAVELIATWAKATLAAPSDISATLYIRGYPGQLISLQMIGVSVGDPDTLSRYFSTLESVAPNYQSADVKAEDWASAASSLARNVGPDQAEVKYKSAMVGPKQVGDAGAVLIEILRTAPPAYLSLSLQALGGQMHQIPADATAFPHREEAGFCLQAATDIRDASRRADRLRALDSLMTALAPHVTGGAYANYPDRDLSVAGSGFMSAYWGTNAPRLRRIKARYDPNGVFRHDQSIPT